MKYMGFFGGLSRAVLKGLGQSKPIFNHPQLAQSSQVRHRSLAWQAPQVIPGHLFIRGGKTGVLCVDYIRAGDIMSPTSRQKVLAVPCHDSGLTKPLSYTSPLLVLQALAVSDHYPVEVKLAA